MTRRQVMRLVAAVLGGVVVALAFVACLRAINSEAGFIGSTAATAAGWMIPMLAGVVATAVAWALLVEDRTKVDDEVAFAGRCSDCGRPVADEWRLCPYCGAMTHAVGDAPLSAAEETPT